MSVSKKFSALDAPTQAFLSSLQSRREAAGLSRDKLAAAIGISKTSLKAFEWGNMIPCLKILLTLADYLGCDLSDSINYQYYHGKLSFAAIKSRMRRYNLKTNDVALAIGYSLNAVRISLSSKDHCTLSCLMEIQNFLAEFEENC